MSGAEAIAVLGLISSVISIIESSRDVYEAATHASGLHRAFRTVAGDIPMVLSILDSYKKAQENNEHARQTMTDDALRRRLEESDAKVAPTMVACREDAESLKRIFSAVVVGDEAGWPERYRKAVQIALPGKKRKVEDLMKDILSKLQLLHTNHYFESELARSLPSAMGRLDALPSSLPEDDGRFHHSGSGSINNNFGSGTQRVYNSSGGSNNRQYNAETMHFGRDD